jgi:hypothetical protein
LSKEENNLEVEDSQDKMTSGFAEDAARKPQAEVTSFSKANVFFQHSYIKTEKRTEQAFRWVFG